MNENKGLTVRQRIIQCLEASPMTAKDLSQAVRISEKDIYSHLPFIKKTIKGTQRQWIVQACKCLNCGFEFKDRKRLTRPGKCPKCRRTRISDAHFHILNPD